MITGQLVGVKNRQNFSSAKIFLAIGYKKPFPDISYRLVYRGVVPFKKKATSVLDPNSTFFNFTNLGSRDKPRTRVNAEIGFWRYLHNLYILAFSRPKYFLLWNEIEIVLKLKLFSTKFEHVTLISHFNRKIDVNGFQAEIYLEKSENCRNYKYIISKFDCFWGFSAFLIYFLSANFVEIVRLSTPFNPEINKLFSRA